LIESWRKRNRPVVGIITEPIQAEGGDNFALPEFFQGLQENSPQARGTPVSSSNKADCHDITEILLKVVLDTINRPTNQHLIIKSNRKTYLLLLVPNIQVVVNPTTIRSRPRQPLFNNQTLYMT
jgi:hypothetical protein